MSRESWPSNPVAGNDDRRADDEDNDPYNAPDHGELTGSDYPGASIRHADGSVGDTVELRLHFREFARLLLGTTWYRISDYQLWRLQVNVRKADEAAAQQDYNADGDQTDHVWIDNGSFVENNNGGW